MKDAHRDLDFAAPHPSYAGMTIPATSLIFGSNGHVGGYLARLLQARGQRILAVADPAIAGDALAALGIAADVEHPALADAIPQAGTVYAINSGGAAAAEAIDSILAARPQRLVHVVDRAVLLASPAAAAAAARITATRGAGLAAATAILGDHDSRLGPADSLAAIVTTAAWRAAQGDTTRLELVETGPRDWGWTPEYVDAVHRLAALQPPRDLAIASGHSLTTAEFADHAFGFFKLAAADHVRIAPAAAPAALPSETAAAPAPPPSEAAAAAILAATGWKAGTWGRDLVRALCEGAATRAA